MGEGEMRAGIISAMELALVSIWWRILGPEDPTALQSLGFLGLCALAFLNAWCVGKACDKEEDEG